VLKEKQKKAIEVRKKAEKKIEPLKQKRDALAEALTGMEKQTTKHKESLRQFDNKRKSHQEKLEKLEEQVETQKSEVEKTTFQGRR